MLQGHWKKLPKRKAMILNINGFYPIILIFYYRPCVCFFHSINLHIKLNPTLCNNSMGTRKALKEANNFLKALEAHPKGQSNSPGERTQGLGCHHPGTACINTCQSHLCICLTQGLSGPAQRQRQQKKKPKKPIHMGHLANVCLACHFIT